MAVSPEARAPPDRVLLSWPHLAFTGASLGGLFSVHLESLLLILPIEARCAGQGGLGARSWATHRMVPGGWEGSSGVG